MIELIKRISTSIILIIIAIISFYHSLILLFSLIFCFYQLLFELFNIGKKIFVKKKTILLFFLFKLLILIYLSILVICIFKIFYILMLKQRKYSWYLLFQYQFHPILEVIYLAKPLKEKNFKNKSKQNLCWNFWIFFSISYCRNTNFWSFY